MERINIVGLLSKQQKLNSSTLFNSNMSMMVMVMGTRALEEGRRNRMLVCLCLPMVMKQESNLVVGMVAGGAIVVQVDSDSLLLKGDLILAVNGTLGSKWMRWKTC